MLQGYSADWESNLCHSLPKSVLRGNPGQLRASADLRGDSQTGVIKDRNSLGDKSGSSGGDFMNWAGKSDSVSEDLPRLL